MVYRLSPCGFYVVIAAQFSQHIYMCVILINKGPQGQNVLYHVLNLLKACTIVLMFSMMFIGESYPFLIPIFVILNYVAT